MVWKNARRHFYWALRSKLAISNAIAQLIQASPDLTRESAERFVLGLVPPHISSKESRAMAEAAEALNLKEACQQLRSAYVAKEMLDLVLNNRKAGVAGLVSIVDALSAEERAALGVALQAASSAERSPGPPSYNAA